MFRKIVLIIVIFNASIFSQRIIEDIPLFSLNYSPPVYPYQNKYDSLQRIESEEYKKLYEKDPNIIIDPIESMPTLYVFLENKEISIQEYSKLIKDSIPDNYWVTIQFRIKWDGTISEAKIVAYEGERPNIELINSIVKNVKAKETLNYYGFPNPNDLLVSWLIKGKNKK